MDRGVVLSEVGRFDLEEIEVGAPGADEVLVRVEASGVCHSDLHVVETGWARGLPVLLGHEGAGVVEEIGEGVSTVAPGDRVVLGWRSPCGSCRWCKRGDIRRCRTPPGVRDRLHVADGRALAQTLQMGTFATRTVVHSAAAIPSPEGLPPESSSSSCSTGGYELWFRTAATTFLRSTFRSCSSGRPRASSISPAWSRSGSGSKTWCRRSTISRPAT